MKLLALALILVIVVASTNAGKMPSCKTVKCAEACLDNPTRCTTKCDSKKKCPAGFSCIKGLCDCPQGKTYQNGRCEETYDKCAAVQCLVGSTCKDGKCSIPN